MIKLNYVFGNESGVLELQGLSSYTKEEILPSLGTSELQFTIIENALKVLNPSINPISLLSACERGGMRNTIQPESEAKRLGFSKLVADIEGTEIVICA